MRPRRYPYQNQKELERPALSEKPLKLFSEIVVSVLLTAKPNNPDHVRLVNELMQTYSRFHS